MKDQLNFGTGSKPKEVSLSATVIRADGTKEELGVISYWNRNPLKNLLFEIKQHFKGPRYSFLKGSRHEQNDR